jgi:hypothetical protein
MTRNQRKSAEAIREKFDIPRVRLAPVAIGEGVKKIRWSEDDGHRAVVDDAGHVHSIVSPHYRLVPHDEGIARMTTMADELSRAFGSYDLDVKLDGSWAEASFVFQDTKVDVGRSDPISPRLLYLNSYDGRLKETIDFGAYRLVCSNGLVIGKRLLRVARFHVGTEEDGAFIEGMEKIPDIFAQVTREWKTWTKADLDVCTLDSGLAPFGKNHQKEIVDEMDKLRAINLWAFYNILTAIVTHRVATVRRRFRINAALARTTQSWGRRV